MTSDTAVKRWDVLVEVTGWCVVGQVEAKDKTEALKLAADLYFDDPTESSLYDGVEISRPVNIEVEEAYLSADDNCADDDCHSQDSGAIVRFIERIVTGGL